MIRLRKCPQCGAGPVDHEEKNAECQWCGRRYTKDEVDWWYFQDSACAEGLKHLCNYAFFNGGKPEYLRQFVEYRNKLQKELETKYEVK